MLALHKALELGNGAKEHGKVLGVSLMLLFAVVYIAFFKESVGVVVKLTLSLFWLYLIPGYFLLGLASDKLDSAERVVLGIVVGLGFYGVVGYNLGLLGVRISLQRWIVPLVGIGIGTIFMIRNSRHAEELNPPQGKEEQ